jgi:hypothetical protein
MSEQALAVKTAEEQPSEVQRQALADVAEPLAERQHGGEPSMARVKQLLSELFGPSPAKWILGLLDVRKKVPPLVNGNWRELERKLDAETKKREALEKELAELRAMPHSDGEAYQRGRESVFAEQEFSERLAVARSKYPDFDAALRSVKPLVPRAVLTAAADLEHGLEALYALSRLPKLCEELAELSDEKAVERFNHFEHDFALMTGAQR